LTLAVRLAQDFALIDCGHFMVFARFVAFTLDLLALALGGLAGFLVAALTVQSTNTIAGMGTIVVFIALSAAGCAVILTALLWMVTVTGCSPGQRAMGLRYCDDGENGKRQQRACHCLMAWLLPVVLVAVPAVVLNEL
jgi:hypothetical protein